MPVAIGAVTVIVPVASEQVGWISVTVGAAGAVGAAVIVAIVIAEIHPDAFLAVTLYGPATRPLNTPDVLT